MRFCAFVSVFTALAGTGAAAYDRSCLIGIADRYLAAMVKHDPAGLPLAPKVKYTENTAAIPVGDGLWVGVSEAPSTFKVYAADPVSGQVAFFGVLKEFGAPVM